MKRSARWFNKRIEIWQNNRYPDGFGGNIVTTTRLTTSWAKVTTTKMDKGGELTEVGINDPSKAIKIMLRKRNDITYNAVNQYVVYDGVKYAITTEPININFNHSFVEFIAVRDRTSNVTEMLPIGDAGDIELKAGELRYFNTGLFGGDTYTILKKQKNYVLIATPQTTATMLLPNADGSNQSLNEFQGGWYVEILNDGIANVRVVLTDANDFVDVVPNTKAIAYWNGANYEFNEHIRLRADVNRVAVSTQTFDINSTHNNAIISMEYEGNYNIVMPQLADIDNGWSVNIIHRKGDRDIGLIVPYSSEQIEGKLAMSLLGNGFVKLSKRSDTWQVDLQASYFDNHFNGRTKVVEFTNENEITINHDLGHVPVVEVWIDDEQGGYVMANVDIDHDWNY